MPSGVYVRTPEMKTGKYKHHPHQLFQKGNEYEFKKGHKVLSGWGFPKGHHPETEIKKGQNGKNNPAWKGGKIKHKGYVFIYKPKHPYAQKSGYIKEHRVIIEQQMNRYLKPQETPHHINRIKDDNRLENLMCFINNSAHIRFHYKPKNVKQKEIVFDGRNLNKNTNAITQAEKNIGGKNVSD